MYTQQMLSRRTSNKDYTSDQAMFWLSVLAKGSRFATTLNERIFLDPSPNWFPFGWQRSVCQGIDKSIIFIEVALLLALFISLIGGFRMMVFPSITILSVIRLLLETIFTAMLLGAGLRFVTSGGESSKIGISKLTAIYGCLGYLLILPLIFLPPQKDPSEVFSLLLAAIFIIFLFILLNIFRSLRHLIARALLHWSGWMPWDYRKFLDYAAERILLRKEGGEYAFIHALLRDYFASLDTSSFLYAKESQGKQKDS
jgi:hypothetical protein